MPSTVTRFSVIRKSGQTVMARPTAGWIGSKAGVKGDLVTIDANGRVDQAVAAGSNIGANTKLAVLMGDVPSTAAQGTEVEIEKLNELSTIELQACDGSDVPVATTAAMIGDSYEISRTSGGIYVVDTATTTNAKVEVIAISKRYPVGEVGGTLICRVLPAARIG